MLGQDPYKSSLLATSAAGDWKHYQKIQDCFPNVASYSNSSMSSPQ